MGGTHRERSAQKLDQLAQSARSLVDAGSTPMWHPPPPYQQESALRSTLAEDDGESKRTDSAFDVLGLSEPPSTPRCDRGRADGSATDRKDVTPASDYPTITFTPINKRQLAPRILPTDSELFQERYSRNIPELSIDMYDVDYHQLGSVDREDGRMYHFGHFGGATYSGTFVEERALPMETLALIDKKMAQQSAALRVAEGPRREREVRALLETGSSLILHKTSAEVDASGEVQPVCALQGCLSRSECIPPATYWFAFQRIGSLGPEAEEDFSFCMQCVEWLWQGHDYTDRPPHPGVLPGSGIGVAPADLVYENEQTQPSPTSEAALLESAFSFDGKVCASSLPREPDDQPPGDNAIPQLDGLLDFPPTPTAEHGQLAPSPFSAHHGSPMPEYGETPTPISDLPDHVDGTDKWRDLLASRHAVSLKVTPEQPMSVEKEGTPESQDSIDSDGEWMYPPTRFQHIAAFIKPGSGLSTQEKAAVWLWKAASQEQLRWELHLRKTKSTRDYYAGLGGAGMGSDLNAFKIEAGDDEEESVQHWEKLTGLQKKDCQGNDLSEILRQVAVKTDAA